jgi:HAD superfamily hydrolase (TIGR01509 family)
MPGVEELLDALEAHNIPKAVATSSSYASARHCLETCNVLHRFSTLVGGDMITNGKPHPEIYLLTAEKLGVDPKNCWALEDSENGTRSAKNAETYTIMVPDLREPTDEMREIADAVVPSLHHVKKMLERAMQPAG